MRAQAAVKTGKPITLALMNAGGMRRSNIAEGELKARDVFELLPFENALVTIDLTGEQLLKLLQTIIAKHEAQSGARLVYKTNADKTSELVSAKLRDGTGEKDIDPKAIYTITTIDYLYRVGGSTYGMLQEGKNMKELGITLRDSVMSYVKAETAAGRDIKPNLDGRFVFDRAGSDLNDNSQKLPRSFDRGRSGFFFSRLFALSVCARARGDLGASTGATKRRDANHSPAY
jgi:2',3'-cyclic-nucleotide 2'-phosphodiesterase (5'-nucleotidase family)